MSFVPKTNWQLNDTVMPIDMNRIEQGITDIETETRPISRGGTGSTSASGARTNLDAQQRTQSLTTENSLVDGDTIPFYDTSASTSRKTAWSNIKSILKTYFDTLYATVSHNHSASNITSGTLSVDRGGTGNTSVNNVLTNWAVQCVADRTIYISPSGNDTTGTGTSGSPYKTLTKALSTVPKNTNGKTIIIDIAVGSYNENVIIKDFTGAIVLRVSGSTAATFSSMVVDNSLVNHTGQQMNFSPDSGGTGLTLQNGACWVGDKTLYCGTGAYGIVVKSGSVLQVLATITLSNLTSTAIDVYGAGRAYVSSIGGSGSTLALSASNGGTLTYGSASISATTKERTNTGGRIYSNAQAQIPNY